MRRLQIGKDDAANVAKIPESHVVMELVADLFPEKDLLPKDPIERAHARYFIGKLIPSLLMSQVSLRAMELKILMSLLVVEQNDTLK